MLPSKTVYYSSVSDFWHEATLSFPAGYDPGTGLCRGRKTLKALIIHGGGWNHLDRSSFDGVADFLNEEGMVVLNIEYRLASANVWPACGDDCLAAADYLLHNGLEELSLLRDDPILIVGASAGGHLALMTGLRLPRENVLGIVSISGIADPAPDYEAHPGRYEQLFGAADTARDAFPVAHLSERMPPILLTHYVRDRVVPVKSATRFAHAAMEIRSRAEDPSGIDVESYLYEFGRENQGHGIWIPGSEPHRLYPDIEERIRGFVRRITGTPSSALGLPAASYAGQIMPTPSRDIRESRVGVGFECLDRDLIDPEVCYRRMGEAGVKWGRTQTGWWKCEKEKGVFTFEWLDRVVDQLLAQGVQPWFNVGYGNKLYMDETFGEASVGHVPLYYGDECREAWLRFARELARHFKGRVRHYEIWNESNIGSFWQPKGVSAADYAVLLDITRDAIREEDPDARCGGCVSGCPFAYLQEMAATGVFRKLDFFCLHPYTTHPEAEWASQAGYARRLLHATNPSLQVWQGEAGYPSWVPSPYWQKRFVRESERNQAVWLLRHFVLDHTLEIDVSSFFMIADMIEKGYQKSSTEISQFDIQRQGVLHGLAYTPKMSYRALQHLTSIFRDGIRRVPSFFHISTDKSKPRDEPHTRLENIAAVRECFVRDGEPFYTYYMPADPQYAWKSDAPADLYFIEEEGRNKLVNPVLVDLLDGSVWNIAAERGEAGWNKAYTFVRDVPLRDYPLVVCNRSAIGIRR